MSKRNWVILLSIFVLLRITLFNINIAESGDSYDFLRIAEAITRGQYPLDAKRLPVFPALIAIGLPIFDAVLWGKIVVFLFSFACLILTVKLAGKLLPQSLANNDYLVLGLLFLFCPVILYWWIRVVAAPVFAFFVLLVLNIYYESPQSLTDRIAILKSERSKLYSRVMIAVYTVSAKLRRRPLQYVLLGAVSGFSAMTRYEGFILFGAIGLGLLIEKLSDLSKPVKVNVFIKKTLLPLLLYSLFFLLIISPWFIRNYINFGSPLYSSYREDPAGFMADFYTRMQWLFYALFMFGFPFGIWAMARAIYARRKNWLAYLSLYIFVLLSLALFFVWGPRARFYSYLVPVLFPFVIFGIKRIAESQRVFDSFALLSLLIVYFIGIWKFRFYFLGAGKVFKIAALLLGGASVGSELFKIFVPRWQKYSYPVLFSLAFLIQIITSFGIIKNNRLIYASVYKAVQDPVLQHAEKTVFYDETGVSHWYLRNNGIYYNQALPLAQQIEWLKEENVDYVLWTNEHNEGQELSVVQHTDYKKYFQSVSEYEYTVGDQNRASVIYKFDLSPAAKGSR